MPDYLREVAKAKVELASSANFLRGFLCKVVLSISPHKQNASLRISIFAIRHRARGVAVEMHNFFDDVG
jgi:hypothetical protein